MDRKRNIIIISSLIILFFLVALINLFYVNKSQEVYENEKSNNYISENILTMMYETAEGSGEYVVASDTTWPQDGYTFNEQLSSCENGGTLTWDDENKRVIMQTNTSDKCYVYFDLAKETFANYIINNIYTEDGENNLYYHDGQGTYGSLEAGDNSYRYSGANPNNYVCFGVTEADCQNEDNQYRIIGVFNNQVKLVKATRIGSYEWNVEWDNTWSETMKPDIYTTLNETYYNTLGSEWQNLIAETTWQVGGMDWSSTNTAKQYYDVEVGTGQSGYEETMKIGLMYASDYGYGAEPESWTKYLDGNGYGINNWLYHSSYEWFISRNTNGTDAAFGLGSSYGEGGLTTEYVVSQNSVYPTFYLLSSITLSGGTGTSTDPFILNLS